MANQAFEFDQVIIGSGFGGSVSALRLSEKGNRVLILEQGKRRNDTDYPVNNSSPKKYLWMPKLGWYGAQQITLTNKVTVIHGIGVGGGSQVYSNVHFIPEKEVFDAPSWSKIRGDWHEQLAPYYKLAQRMLGTAKSTYENIADDTLKETAKSFGREDSYKTVETGVLFPRADGKENIELADPYFNGAGPARTTCQYCAACSIGCRFNSKNTLSKNYLFFAERNGAEIRADSQVLKIEPITEGGVSDGSYGYRVTVQPMGDERAAPYQITTRGVVVSAGVLATVPLLMRMRDQEKTLPNISKWLGQQIRTNSETLITSMGMNHNVSEGVAISSFISVDDDTNVEINRVNKGSDRTFHYLSFVPMVTGQGITRIAKFIGNTVLHPLLTFKMLRAKGMAENSVILLVMQKSEAFVHFEWRRKWYRLFRKDISAVQNKNDVPISVSFPAAEKAAKEYASKLGGHAGSALSEIVLGTPTTAHIMSGVPMGTDSSNGVIDESGEVFGYKNLRVLDGSVISGNLGVNPSLTITALSEYAMSKVPVFDQHRADQVEKIRFSEPLDDMVSKITTDEVHELIGTS